jgi:acetyl/propionyl-CoA carboxylase alpha subunit
VIGLSQIDNIPGFYGVRVDTGVAVGSVVGSDYDPMLAKVIAHGRDRADAIERLDGFLGAAAAVHGVTTNVGFLRRLLALDIVSLVRRGGVRSVALGGWTWELEPVVHRGTTDGPGGADDGVVRSPMPGTVIAVDVAVGDVVTAGQAVAIVEAMKMEHTLTAPTDGTVAEVHASIGGSVALDAPVVTITAHINAEA